MGRMRRMGRMRSFINEKMVFPVHCFVLLSNANVLFSFIGDEEKSTIVVKSAFLSVIILAYGGIDSPECPGILAILGVDRCGTGRRGVAGGWSLQRRFPGLDAQAAFGGQAIPAPAAHPRRLV